MLTVTAPDIAPPSHPAVPRLKINPELIVSFVDGVVTFHLPSTHRTWRSDAGTLRVLGAACDPQGVELRALAREFTRESLLAALESLMESKVLVPDEEETGLPIAWRDWGEAAWFLHLATKDTRFAIEPEAQLSVAQDVSSSPMPARYKCLCTGGTPIELPRPRAVPAASFSEVLINRRTCRHFTDRLLTLAEVSDLCFYTGGVVFENETRYFGTVLKKCSPSPGARHGTEMYLALRNCAGVAPGIYHYCVCHHRLNRVHDADPSAVLSETLVSQDYFAAAPLVVFFTCVVERLMWKYKGPRIYRLTHLEVGHYCQNFLLTGTALGLGVFCTGALAETVIEGLLGIDGIHEFPLYTAGAGYELEKADHRRGVILSENLPAGLEPKLPGDVYVPA
jgi:SagB-type dehydrogenase family enzyme